MKYLHVELGEKYVKDVIAGKILASELVRLACERHISDKQRSKTAEFPYKFDALKAERVCQFAELLPHVKGKWAAKGEPFVLQPWQCFLFLSIFGWVHKSGEKQGKRRFRKAMLLVPRKNGKSDIAARIGLWMFAADNEAGAEVFSGATSEKQANFVFDPAHKMAQRTPAFLKRYGVEVRASNLYIPSTGSKFERLIGKPGDGASPSCAIIDEYHEHADDTMVDAMLTGMGARDQALLLIITTAGDNLGGPCYLLQKDLESILRGTVQDEEFWGMVYGIDDDDDWTTDESHRKANPNYNISVSGSFLDSEKTFAVRNSRKQGTHKTKHLDVWVGAMQAYFNMQAWSKCSRPGIKPEDFKGCPLFVGADLASQIDIAAIYMLFQISEKRYAGFGKFYIPNAQIEGGENQHYAGWAKDGHMIVTGEGATDFDEIEKDVMELHRDFRITQFGFDFQQSPMLVQHLIMSGIPCVETRKNIGNFAAPMKQLDALIIDGQFDHDGNPCMTWQMGNVVCPPRLLLKDLAISEKEKQENKIDGPDALITALSRALTMPPAPKYQMMFVG